ncbi:MAG: NlpC/P60 family protein [Pseudomonadota bacterium]
MHAAQFIAAARLCLGTRFRHQGRSPAHGLDCVGLIIVAARSAGREVHDMRAYGRQPQPADFARYIKKNALSSADTPSPGAIGLFSFGAGPQHAGIFTDIGIIHAYAPARKVIEHGFRDPWPSYLSAIFQFQRAP